MADKGTKTRAKAKREPESVLGSLPATRPERLGRPRRGAAKAAAREVPVAKAQGRGARPAKAAPPRAKAPAPKTAKAATKRAKPAAKRAPVKAHGPAAVSAGCPPLERSRASEPPPRPIGAPSGTELVTTAIQATGELARIGLTVGGQVLKRAVDRIPRP
jgi:hypothetical protein